MSNKLTDIAQIHSKLEAMLRFGENKLGQEAEKLADALTGLIKNQTEKNVALLKDALKLALVVPITSESYYALLQDIKKILDYYLYDISELNNKIKQKKENAKNSEEQRIIKRQGRKNKAP